MSTTTKTLTAKVEPFDSFWEMPGDIEGGYKKFSQFYRHNYLRYFPADKVVRILVIGCGPGYLVNLLAQEGYTNVLGIDSTPDKVQPAQRRGLNCRPDEAFPFLERATDPFDVIVLESEINHLTNEEIIQFLTLCWNRLRPSGTLIIHSLNGANPITGYASLAQNFDHYNTFTDLSLAQAVRLGGFDDVTIIPLNSYVFFANPLNYIAWGMSELYTLVFRLNFLLYGKPTKLFTKKIAAIARKAGA